MALNKNIILTAKDQQIKMKEFIKNIRKFLLFILDQPSNVYKLCEKKTI